MKVREPTLRLSRAQRATIKQRQRVGRFERRLGTRQKQLFELRRQYEAEQLRIKALRDRFTERRKQVNAERSEWRKERELLDALRNAVKNEAFPLKVRTWDEAEPKPDEQGVRQMVVRVKYTFSQHPRSWIVLHADIESIE